MECDFVRACGDFSPSFDRLTIEYDKRLVALTWALLGGYRRLLLLVGSIGLKLLLVGLFLDRLRRSIAHNGEWLV